MNNDFQNGQKQNEQQQNEQQYYGPYYGGYQQGGYQQGNYQQGGFFGNPFDPRMVDAQSKARSAQTFGIVALVGLFTLQILSIIFGILAMQSAKKSRMLLGYELPEAKTGRILGLVSLIISIVSIALTILVCIFYFFFILALIA